MELIEYQEKIKKFVAKLESSELDACHMLLGALSEINEISDAINDKINLQEEIGDIIFYLVNYATIRNISLSNIDVKYDTIRDAIYWLSKLSDIFKKELVYKKKSDLELEAVYINNCINKIITTYCSIEELPHIIKINYNKLNFRYGDKFSEERANNRDLITERSILEK